MEKQKRSKITDLGGIYLGGVIGAVIGLSLGVCGEHARNSRELSGYGYEKAMEQYEPVRNGGALASMNGDITPRRVNMYQVMQEAYENAVKEEALEGITDYKYGNIKKRTQVKETPEYIEGVRIIPLGY